MNIVDRLKQGFLLGAVALSAGLVSCQRDGAPKHQPTSKTKIDHLLIKEIFYVGHSYIRDTRKTIPDWPTVEHIPYPQDVYVIIYNPTDEVKYLDGLALASNSLDPSQLRTFSAKENYVSKYYGASGISFFPGKGTEHPIPPKGTVVVAKYAIDHKAKEIASIVEDNDGEPFNPEEYKELDPLLDLSKADFEWTCSRYLSEDDQKMNNPQVPDLEPIYQFTNSKGNPDSDYGFKDISGSMNIALIKLPWTPEDFAKNYKDTKDHKGYLHYISINSSNFADYYTIEVPNDHVIDCVTICPKSQYQMKTTKLDKGHNAIADVALSTLSSRAKRRYYGLALTRRWDGRKFIDGDNSTQDFEVKTASLARKDAQGNLLK